MVKPIQEKFIELQNQMNKFYGDEREQLENWTRTRKLFSLNQSLQAEAKHLTNALKGESRCKALGRIPIRRILEQVGLVKAFTIQSNRHSGMRRASCTDRISSSTSPTIKCSSSTARSV